MIQELRLTASRQKRPFQLQYAAGAGGEPKEPDTAGHVLWRSEPHDLLLDAQRLRVDVDEGVGIAVVATAGDDADAVLDQAPHDAKVLVAGLDRHRLALRMLRIGGRKPIAAVVKAAELSARFARARAARFR